jgi:ubiquinone/menaquinone biosynthesis C-methylase UbiE
VIKETLSTRKAQSFYDRIGAHYDIFEMYEARAKERARQLLEVDGSKYLLNVGVGTGREHARIQQTIGPGSIAFGVDISPVMTELASQQTGTPICRADTHCLPYASGSFDQIYIAYVLDLIPLRDIPTILEEFWRVLRPGGELLILALTEGVDIPSRALVTAWKLVYAFSPLACGGCRPLQLSDLVKRANYTLIQRQVIVQMAVPSEILLARKDRGFVPVV